MEEQMQNGLHRNGLPQYSVESMQYYNRAPQNGFDTTIGHIPDNGRSPHVKYGPPQTFHFNKEQVDRRFQKDEDAARYAELYEEVYAPRSRTPSGLMTSTERTRGTQAQTTYTSRSTSEYGSSDSSSSESESDDDRWEDNIFSALNDMAGNLKRIGGIRCNKAGLDSTEVQLKINLPLPIHNLDTVAKDAMASLSPKKCNMQYDYSHLDDQVLDMEEQFLGAMDKLQGVMPVYRSLFQSQSDSSSEDDDDDNNHDPNDDEVNPSQSTYEDPRFLPKETQKLQQQEQDIQVPLNTAFETNVDGIPLQILISDQPSEVSSCDSWMLLSPRNKLDDNPAKSAADDIMNKINNNLDAAVRGSKIHVEQNQMPQQNDQDDQWIPATKQKLVLEDPEDIEKDEPVHRDVKPIKSKTALKTHIQIPQVIDCTHTLVKNNGHDIPECYSDLTIDFRKAEGVTSSVHADSDKDKDKSISNIPMIKTQFPMIKTQFSGDEIMGRDEASFQRNSAKRGTVFKSESDDLGKQDADLSKAGSTAESSQKVNMIEKIKFQDSDHVMFDKGDETMGKVQASDDKPIVSELVPGVQASDDKPISDVQASDDKPIVSELVPGVQASDDKPISDVQASDDKPIVSESEVPDDEFDNFRGEESEEERKQMEAWEKKRKKLLEERKRLEKEAQEADEAEAKRKVEMEKKRIEEEAKAKARAEAQRIAEKAAAKAETRAKEERERVEEETKQGKKAREARQVELEEIQRQADIKAQKEAEKLEEERKLMEAEAKAAREALNAKKLEEERRRAEVEAKVKAEEEATAKAQAQARARAQAQAQAQAQAEAESKAKAEAEAEEKAKAVQEALEAKIKFEEDQKRVEAEARAKEEALAKLKLELEEETKRIKAGVKADARAKSNEEDLERQILADERRGREGDDEKSLSNEKLDTLSLDDRASLYKIQGFDDYCKGLSRQSESSDSLDTDHSEKSSEEERSTSNIESHNEEKSNGSLHSGRSGGSRPPSLGSEDISVGTGSISEESTSSNSLDASRSSVESDTFSDATPLEEDFEEHSETDSVQASITKNIGTRSVNFMLSGGETANSRDKTVQSSARRRANPNGGSMTSQLLSSASYTSDMPITLAATMSTIQTSDQGTVQSGQRSLGRFVASDESVISSTSYSHQSVMSAKPIVTRVTSQRREYNRMDNKIELRSSILGSIFSLVLRLMLSTLVFVFMWIKHVVSMIGKKRPAKIDCTPTRHALQPGQSIRREEIQDRSLDNFVHRANTRRHGRSPYLLHEEPCREHYTTTMVMKPPVPSGHLVDDSDEVGTCVESIVPDTHCPNSSDGKISTWKITPEESELSSLSSPSKSFQVLKKAYSAFSLKKPEAEKLNWIDHETIDDEMSYYDQLLKVD